MSDPKLLAAFQEWRDWAEAEGAAIRAGDWGRLAKCQEALLHLQARITNLAPTAGAVGLVPDADRQSEKVECTRLVAELIALENRNHTLLAERSQITQTQLQELDRSAINLRRVQQSYAPGRASVWTSFS